MIAGRPRLAQALLYVIGMRARDAPRFIAGVRGKPAAQLVAARTGHRNRIAAAKIADHVQNADGQEAASRTDGLLGTGVNAQLSAKFQHSS